MADRWEELEKRCQNCRECSLCETRTNVVFGDGSRTAEIMFVGEGPGAHEWRVWDRDIQLVLDSFGIHNESRGNAF